VSDAETSRYPARVFWSEEDEGFIAVAPDLPGCSAFGASQQEALTELQDAIAAWKEAALATGNPIPRPSVPSEVANYSGKVLVRMPKSLHAQIAKQAKSEGVSLNQHIVFLLTMATTHRTFESVKISEDFVITSLRHASRTAGIENLYIANINQSRCAEIHQLSKPTYISTFPGKVVARAAR